MHSCKEALVMLSSDELNFFDLMFSCYASFQLFKEAEFHQPSILSLDKSRGLTGTH